MYGTRGAKSSILMSCVLLSKLTVISKNCFMFVHYKIMQFRFFSGIHELNQCSVLLLIPFYDNLCQVRSLEIR